MKDQFSSEMKLLYGVWIRAFFGPDGPGDDKDANASESEGDEGSEEPPEGVSWRT